MPPRLRASRRPASPLDPDATELALLSLECAEASRPWMAEVALRLLATAWDPGFMGEPGWLASLEDAMRLVNRDAARHHDKAAVWWCAGDDGHPVAAIGEWPKTRRTG